MKGLDELVEVLDAQIALVDALVEVAQRERVHLIAFEPHRVQACVDEKRILLDRGSHLEELRQDALEDILEALALTTDDAPSVEDLIPLLPAPARDALRERAARLRDQVETLKTHHTVNQLHTERALRWVNAYVGLLRGATEPAPTNRYAASGRNSATPAPGATSTVHRRA